MSFHNFRNEREQGLSTKTYESIQKEIQKRESLDNPFPLDVFHESVKPYIEALNQYYDIPRSFVGLMLMSCYSSAIGTSFTVTTNGRDQFYLPVWGCMLGISSSGKSLAFKKIFEPLIEIQDEFDQEWDEKTSPLKEYEIKFEKIKTAIFRDAHIPTLVKYVMPDNPKGVVKMSDELLEWINGMNQLSKKEGTDEQFWLSSWNCSPYSGIRSGKSKFVLKRPFVNVVGGIQYTVLHKLFAKDRDTTGFVFRLLFAQPEVDRIADPDPDFDMSQSWIDAHTNSIVRLYKDLEVKDETQKPKQCRLTPPAVSAYREWVKFKIHKINNIEDLQDRDIQSGILGKIKEYALRFAAILHLADKALEGNNYDPYFTWSRKEYPIDSSVMERALRLSDYFFQAAVDTYERVQNNLVAPQEVLYAATLLRMGQPTRKIAELMWGVDDEAAKKRMYRQMKKWITEYPKVFNAIGKT